MDIHAVHNQDSRRQTSRRRRVLLTACLGVFVSFASIVIYTFGVFLKPVSLSFGWSRTQMSVAFMLAAMTVGVSSPLLGYLLDRFPARRIVLPCTLVYAAAFASLSMLTNHLWHLYAIFVVLGVVGNGTTQLPYGRVVSAWFDANRGQALAAVMAGSGLGSVVFPTLAQALISTVGWRTAYTVLGSIIAAVALPLAWLFLYEPRLVVDTSEQRPSVRKSLSSAPFLGICFALLLFSFATNGLNMHWVPLLTDGGATPRQAAYVLSVAGFAALAGKLGTGYLLDRFRAGRVAAVLFLLCAVGFLICLHSYSLTLALLSAVLVGVAMGSESDVVPYLLTRYFGLQQFGQLYGYTWFVYAVAGATGPVVMGFVFDRTGSYRSVLTVCLGMVVLGAVAFAALPGYSRKSSPKPVDVVPEFVPET